jgi:hypothetical protein
MPKKLTRTQDESALIVRLRGGLGNQLFQYAAGRSLAARSGVPLLLDTKSGFQADPYGRFYALGSFKLCDGISEVDSTRLGASVELRRRLVRSYEILRLKLLGRYFSRSIHRLRISRPTVLDAYCQSPRYFSGIEDVLKKELAFKAVPTGVDRAVASEIGLTNSVCVHARRLLGVCANPANTQSSVVNYYGVCEISYYRNALRALADEFGPVTAYLFSDDPIWAEESAQSLGVPGCTVKVINEQDTLTSFYLMRLCKHFVLANSTFGWWAAWLGEFAGKSVYIPPVWNRGEKRFPHELFPQNWRVVSVSGNRRRWSPSHRSVSRNPQAERIQ